MAIRIMNAEQIHREYGLPRDYVFQLLNTKGCPVLPRSKPRETYRVIQEEFEVWLRKQHI